MFKTILAGLIAGSALLAPALADSERKYEPCLNNRLIDGFEKATRSSVVLTQNSKRFLVSTVGTCVGLNYAETVATVSHTTCFTPGDKIVFRDSGMRQSCMARDVTYLPKEAAR